uniref:Secreted protein n=4 Tax=Wuchereria bancrofti TaxID=6293 RepID=A0AAF5RSZ1_WUCBA
MYFLFSSILIIIFITTNVEANVEITIGKNDSCENELNQTSMAVNSSMCNIVRTLDDDWSQTEENATSLSKESVKSSINDNFDDLKGRISMETLDLIKRLHMQYLNVENSKKQAEFSTFNENKSKKKGEEIIRISGKLEIL